jgi:hypothetical protein
MPNLLVVNLLELARKVLTVSATTVESERLTCLRIVVRVLVELLKDRPVRSLENGRPVQGAAAHGRGVRVVHVVHPGNPEVRKKGGSSDEGRLWEKERNVPFGADEWEEGLHCLFDGLVERL